MKKKYMLIKFLSISFASKTQHKQLIHGKHFQSVDGDFSASTVWTLYENFFSLEISIFIHIQRSLTEISTLQTAKVPMETANRQSAKN